MAETVVLVPSPAADRAVSRWRRAHTGDGADGMPAHVTLLYPFADSRLLVAGMVSELREELARFPPFTLRLARLARFTGPPAVLYAVPEPRKRFLAMTAALTARFGFLPYGGVHSEVIPHLTIAIAEDPVVLDAAEGDAAQRLPISDVVDAVEVWEHDPAGWRRLHAIPLGE
jgi:2'-5' RNA ligase